MPRKNTPTLGAAIAEYQETRQTYVAATTLANDWSLLRSFSKEIGEGRQLHTLEPREVELWFARKAGTQKASSYNKLRTRLKGFMDFARRRGWVTVDLVGEVRPKAVVKRERMRLAPDELLDLPRHTHNARDRAFVILACNTALRANEITTLRVRDVDLHSGWLAVSITKSGKEDRMPISQELDAALREWSRIYEEDAGELQADWFLFPRREPGKGRQNGKGQFLGGREFHVYGSLLPDKQMANPAEIVQKALLAQGHHIEKGEGVHTLRRSVARAYFDSRVSAGYDGALRETSALLHHSSSQVTEHYLGLTTERLGRDKALKGRPFLSSMVEEGNVQPLRKVM